MPARQESALTNDDGRPIDGLAKIGRRGAVQCGPAQLAGSPGTAMLSRSTRPVLMGQHMISIAVQGYGIVIWDGDGEWRTFTPSDAMSAVLAARVEQALEDLPATMPSDEVVCSALLSIAGAHLLAVDCDHGPGGCDGEDNRN